MMGNRLARTPAPGEGSPGQVSRWLGLAPRLLTGLLRCLQEERDDRWWWRRWWKRRPLGPLRGDQQLVAVDLLEEVPEKEEEISGGEDFQEFPEKEEEISGGEDLQEVPEKEGVPGAHPGPPRVRWDHLEICFNLLRHLFDLCVVVFLRLASPILRATLDILGLGPLLGLWLHGMGLFLIASFGMSLLLRLLQAYLPQAALVYGALQLLVLGISLRRDGTAPGEEGVAGDVPDPPPAGSPPREPAATLNGDGL